MVTQPLIATSDDYVLGRTSHEYQRLRRQAQLFEAATRRVFEQAGLREGMSCLDVGCGPGEVMRLMGEMVGPSGSVAGLDLDAGLGREMLGNLQAAQKGRFSFFEADIETLEAVPGAPFDVTFARLLLFHVRHPIAVLRKMVEWTKPGGYVIVQDFDLRTVDIHPRLAMWDEFERVVHRGFERAGRDIHLGIKLPAYFVESGLGAPDGTDTCCLAWPLGRIGEMFAGVYRSLLPKALASGVTTEAESQRFFDELNRAAAGSPFHTALSPLLVSVWKRKPA